MPEITTRAEPKSGRSLALLSMPTCSTPASSPCSQGRILTLRWKGACQNSQPTVRLKIHSLTCAAASSSALTSSMGAAGEASPAGAGGNALPRTCTRCCNTDEQVCAWERSCKGSAQGGLRETHSEQAGPRRRELDGLEGVAGVDGPHKGVRVQHLCDVARRLHIQQRRRPRQEIAPKAAGRRCNVGEVPPVAPRRVALNPCISRAGCGESVQQLAVSALAPALHGGQERCHVLCCAGSKRGVISHKDLIRNVRELRQPSCKCMHAMSFGHAACGRT
jgi:hypothetical protein